jgi:NAD(P)-dependent dehydrogenase (short-subunit alcohol dehydrogenase family)
MAIFVRAPLILVRAALPDMKKRGFGRIVNNTTSYVTMLRVLPYGAAKAALESMSAVWAKELDGSGITVNVLVPGGPTDTPLIADASGWPRDKMLRPEIMGPPTAWLISDEAKNFSGRRITAARWDKNVPAAEAALRASRAIGWPELSADAVWLTGKN